jgi:hypothetical protein
VKTFLVCTYSFFVCVTSYSQSGTYCIENRFSEKAFFDSTQITVTRNVVYSIPRKWPGTGFDTLKMDLYYPSASAEVLSKRPCIVFFYGGAWILGNKSDVGIQKKFFEWARRGFVVAAPNYRLGWNCSATDLLGVCVLCQGVYYNMNTAVYRGAQDGKAAMRFMVANQSAYKIDTGAMFIGGESAGSYNAIHTVYWDHKYAKKVFNGGPYSILGSIDSAGGNIGVPFTIKGVINSCGAVVNDTALKYKPIPMVAFHDEADCVVPYQVNQTLNCCATSFFWAKGSLGLYNDLSKTGVAAELHHVPGVTPAHCSYPSITLVKESSCFLKKVLCGLSPTGSWTYPTTPSISCNLLKTNSLTRDPVSNVGIGPLPADEKVTLYFQLGSMGESVIVYNNLGQVIRTNQRSIGNSLEIDTKSLKQGAYILFMRWNDGKSGSKRISVMH